MFLYVCISGSGWDGGQCRINRTGGGSAMLPYALALQCPQVNL